MLNLIRYKNLLFIALIQWLITYALIDPLLIQFGMSILTPGWITALIILSTAFIAAGGYIINDYFDLKIDRINRPDKVIVGEKISKQSTMRFYQVITGIGILLGLIVAYAVKSFTVGFSYIVVPGVLWFYSASYKRQLIIGNLLVSALAALTILLPLLAEDALLVVKYGEFLKMTPVTQTLYSWVCGFAIFAFLWTWIREVIKDAEDIVGDSEMECRTMPIVWGETVSKIFVTCLVIATTLLLYVAVANWITVPDPDNITVRYLLFGIVVPSACLVMLLWSSSCQAYKNASTMAKFIMLIGILYTLVYYYLVAKAFHIAMFGLFQIV